MQGKTEETHNQENLAVVFFGLYPQLLLDLVVMLFTTLMALFALARGSLALRALYAATPKQEPLHAEMPPQRNNQRSSEGQFMTSLCDILHISFVK